MYLAELSSASPLNYQIRCSLQQPGHPHPVCHTIFELGTSPDDHFELIGDQAVLFSSELLEAVDNFCTRDCSLELEDLLWKFIPREIRDNLSRFKRNNHAPITPLSADEQHEIARTVHIFDRRRLYYLYYGAVDQSRLFRMHEKLCRKLLGKCRDEREYLFNTMERSLNPGEYRNYLYSVFNLQRHFTAAYASFLPEALPGEQVAEHFIDDLCDVNGSTTFWLDENPTQSLHHHLVRYLIMYFDYSPARRSFADEFINNFMNSRRSFSWPAQSAKADPERVEKVFGVSLGELRQMDGKELTRLFRQKAKELHPDQGGDHDRFVELSELFRSLMDSKG